MENDLGRCARERRAEMAKANDDLQAEVAERKRVAEDLGESEAQYWPLFANSIDGVLLTAPDGRILAVNGEACRIFRRTEEDLRQLGRTGVVDATDPRLTALLEERSRTGKCRGELTLLRGDGTAFEAEISSAVFTDRDGAPRTSMIVRDITERKRSEERLRRSEADLAEAQRIAKIGSWNFDTNTNEVRWSEEVFRIFDIEKSEFDGTYGAFLNRVHPDDRRRVLEENSDARAGKDSFEIEYRVITRSGEVKIIREIGYARKGPAGRVVGLLGTAQDITERKRATEALRARTQHLEAIRAVTTEITRELNFTKLLVLIIQSATDLVGASAGRVWLWDEEAQVLAPKAWQGPVDWIGEVQLRLGEGVVGTIARTRKGLIVNDYTESPYAHPLFRERGGFTAVMGEPLLYRDRLLGALMVSDQGTERSFSDPDHETLRLFATQAAIAIENARLFQSVSEQHAQLRTLTARLADAGEMERQQLSRELHDCVGGNLSAVNLNLSILQSQLQTQGTAGATARIEASIRLVEEAVQHIRSVMIELRPPLLDDQGVVASLRWYVDQFSARTSVASAVRGEEPSPRLPRSAEIALFRIAQEVLTNVAKHAQAREVTLIVEATAEQGRLTIADDGVGFDPATVRPSGERPRWGLITMRERAVAIGGSLRVESRQGSGTRVIVEVPR